MARNKSYSESMNEWAEEKKFLRKFRHKAFHPDYESPLVARLFGYFLRLIIFLALAFVGLMIRNRSYFGGSSFKESLRQETDALLAAESSEMSNVSWKSSRASLNYKAKGGAPAFFKEIDAKRIRFLGDWNEMLLKNDWKFRELEIGELNMQLKGGATPGKAPEAPPPRTDSWWTAIPDYNTCEFGKIALGDTNFTWGSHWSAQGSLKHGVGSLQRSGDEWTLELSQGLLSQNWLKDLKLDPSKPLLLTKKADKLTLNAEQLKYGQSGQGSLKGVITLGEMPVFDLQLELKTIRVEEILPEEFHAYLTGTGDLLMRIKGSTNSKDGISTEGSFTIVEKGRMREFPLLGTLAVVTGKAELRNMPLAKSTISFTTKKGTLSITEFDLVSGDVAKVRGAAQYVLDTRALEKGLIDLKSNSDEPEKPLPKAAPGEFGFRGDIEIGVPWKFIGDDEAFRARHFKPDESSWGWITVPLSGPIKNITEQQANIMDRQLAELNKRAKNPFQDSHFKP